VQSYYLVAPWLKHYLMNFEAKLITGISAILGKETCRLLCEGSLPKRCDEI